MIQYKDMTEIMKEAMIEANCLLLSPYLLSRLSYLPDCAKL